MTKSKTRTQSVIAALWLAFTMFMLMSACGIIAWTLCFEATDFGGWLPFALLTAGPLLGCIVGVVLVYLISGE